MAEMQKEDADFEKIKQQLNKAQANAEKIRVSFIFSHFKKNFLSKNFLKFSLFLYNQKNSKKSKKSIKITHFSMNFLENI